MNQKPQKSAVHIILYSQFVLFPKAFAIGMMIGMIGIILGPFLGTDWVQQYTDDLEV